MRWRIVDLCQWIFEEFRVVVAKDIEPGIARHGILSQAFGSSPRHHAQAEGAIEDFKKALPRAWTGSREKGRRSGRDRGLVRRREARIGQKNKITPPMGQARHAPERADGSTNRLRLYLRRDLFPRTERVQPLVMPRCNTEAMNLHL